MTIEGIAVRGSSKVGGLAGEALGIISNSHTSGNVTGNNSLGGLIGAGTDVVLVSIAPKIIFILNSSSEANVFWSSNGSGAAIGGLIGELTHGSISFASASGYVSGSLNVGGLVGGGIATTVMYSSATGSVSGLLTNIGGLIGRQQLSFHYRV